MIKLLAVVDGKAQIDTDGNGAADSGLGIDDAERARLAATRHVGDELWRVPMNHFTPWDHNWPYAPDPDAVPPNPPEPRVDIPANRKQGECNKKGSIIGCQGQTLSEELDVVGTPFKLRYDSRRAGRRTDRSMEIPLTGRTIPASLEQVRLEVSVAGRKQTHDVRAQGQPVLRVRLGPPRRLRPRGPGPPAGHDPDRLHLRPAPLRHAGRVRRRLRQVLRPRRGHRRPAATRTRSSSAGARSATSSTSPSARSTPAAPASAAGSSTSTTPMTRGCARSTAATARRSAPSRCSTRWRRPHQAGDPRDADVAPDGSVWVANAATDQVLRFDQQGNGTVMAGSTGGGGCENCRAKASNATASDDPLAKGFPLARPMSVALAPDGGFYIADYLVDYGVQTGYIYRVDPAGRIKHIAGCLCTALGDGGSALQASMTPLDLAVGPDGTLYLADYKHSRIRAIDADGTIRTVAGGGPEASGYQDGIAGTEARLWEPMAVEAGPEGEVYFGDDGRNPRVRRLDPDGTVTTVAGGKPFDADDNGDGGPATAANFNNPAVAVARHRRQPVRRRPRSRPACQPRRRHHDGRRRRRRAAPTGANRVPCGQRALRRRRRPRRGPRRRDVRRVGERGEPDLAAVPGRPRRRADDPVQGRPRGVLLRRPRPPPAHPGRR